MSKVLFVHDTSVRVPDQGLQYLNCAKCLEELKSSGMIVQTSPKEYARQQVSITPTGIQVWCTRHEISIDHITVQIKEE